MVISMDKVKTYENEEREQRYREANSNAKTDIAKENMDKSTLQRYRQELQQ